MKKLGLIGGTEPESTIEYYRQIEYAVQEKTGAFPNLAIESLSVFDVLRFCRKADYDGLVSYLVEGFRCLADAGADFACLTGITPHIVFDRVAADSPIPIVSMVEAACQRAKELGFTRIALLGTYPTMSGTFFQTTGGQWIFVLDKSGSKAYRRNIRIGRQNPQYYEVLEGLEPGERVVISGYEAFKDNEVLVIK